MRNRLPLEGIKVLDLNRFLPGQYAAMLMAEAGAEVIKIEDPGFRATIFRMLQGREASSEEEKKWNAVYVLDRGKKSLALDLKTDAGKEVFLRLAEKTDVIIEGFRPGVTKKLGIDYDTIKEMNSKVIYCAVTGYGQDGPYQMLPARDLTCMGLSGILGVVNEGRFPPIVPGTKIADLASSMYCTIGILMALAARDKSGRGQFVDISMVDGAVSWLTAPLMNYYFSGNVPGPGAVYLSGKRPGYNVYRTKDGKYISIALREPKFWKKLCNKLGRGDLLPLQNPDDDKFDEVVSALQEVFLSKTRDELFEEFKDIGVGKVYTLDELDSDPQIRHRRMIVDIDVPGVGMVKQAGNPVKLSDTPLEIRSLSPARGQHTMDILLEAGYSEERIKEFYENDVVA
ncbi:MAG: CaiB/BaiF CoA-transferase family protein [Desulfatiglans sp.]|jgi:crotonobetainyl-CoA:carnitine CoA-transferase CaiB-like acyl-CoA transferase|nr:CaiB/BaiF CoA-transferase family protein [Thermodesulfobacteriota bacterium]MEE4354692.1 CaiB/BaiF CoA-transferase family protein [Desulfatiglans sp.]